MPDCVRNDSLLEVEVEPHELGCYKAVLVMIWSSKVHRMFFCHRLIHPEVGGET